MTLLYLSIMSLHVQIDKEGIYFITFTCYQWLPLVACSDGYDAVYNFFRAMERQGHSLLAYVIMPNHLHFLLHYAGGKNLNQVIGNGKRFMAYEIVNRLHERHAAGLLKKMSVAVSDRNKAKGQKHEVWRHGFDAKECRTEAFIMQKLAYIHANPVQGRWALASHFLAYSHSSAPFYCSGRQQLYKVKTTGIL